MGFPGGSDGKKSAWFDPWVGKIPWSREWQPTPAYLPGESHGQVEPRWATVHGVAKSWTRLRGYHFHFSRAFKLAPVILTKDKIVPVSYCCT